MNASVLAEPALESLQRYLRKTLTSHLELVSVLPLTGGASNQMFVLEAPPVGRLVLRRPPDAKTSATAHNVSREHRMLAALEGTDVPHPRSILLCLDPHVIGAPFLLMEHVDGFVLQDPISPEATKSEEVRRLALLFIDGLAKIANVDWRGIGLDGFGRPQGFLTRQVDRWLSQLESYHVRPLPELRFLSDWLGSTQPEMGVPAILHGDYQFLNVIFRQDSQDIAAIVDWEQSTIGDPLLDLGWMLGLWAEPGEQSPVSQGTWLTQKAGMPRRAELAQRYAAKTGRELSNLRYYEVLALFKLGCILEGSYARHLAGTSTHRKHSEFGWMVPKLFETAADIARGRRD